MLTRSGEQPRTNTGDSSTVNHAWEIQKMQSSIAEQASLRYDVFLSLRGTDVRKSFADHLYVALVNAGLHTFRDKEGVRRGKSIKSEIEKAIGVSTSSVIIFSKDYASSEWCLHELELIMERNRTGRHHILPVFYKVLPSQVKHQTGKYATAFAEHEQRFKGHSQVRVWRKALPDVAGLGGMILENRYETVFIKDIINEIRKMVDKQDWQLSWYPAGTEHLVNQIVCRLQNVTNTIGIPIIFCDVGGISPLAKASVRVDGLTFLSKFSASNLLEGKGSNAQNNHGDTKSTKESACTAVNRLQKPGLLHPQDVVAREDLISEIDGWVRSATEDVGVMTLFGMRGAAKTSVARIVYESNYARFDASSFLTNIKKHSGDANGLVYLQRKLLRDLTKKKAVNICNIDDGIIRIKAATYQKRVLVVLGNVYDSDQFGAAIKMQKWLHRGSKIIVTTRYEWMMKSYSTFG